jgi:hypothetical protein
VHCTSSHRASKGRHFASSYYSGSSSQEPSTIWCYSDNFNYSGVSYTPPATETPDADDLDNDSPAIDTTPGHDAPALE